MSVDSTTTLRASRYRVARSRGAASGVLLVLLGAWAAVVPFIGPYFDLAYTPQPNTAWHWTAARGWLEVLPGGVAALGGLLLILSTSRVLTSFGAWLAAAGGAWLLVGPALSASLKINLGTPDPSSRRSVQALEQLLFFYAVGALIVFLAGLALGRLTVNSMRDVRAAERRLAEETANTAGPATSDPGRHTRPDQSGAQPAPDAPTTQQPVVDQPTSQQPAVGQPTTQQPTYASAPPPPPPTR
jgi:hypothetical protein